MDNHECWYSSDAMYSHLGAQNNANYQLEIAVSSGQVHNEAAAAGEDEPVEVAARP